MENSNINTAFNVPRKSDHKNKSYNQEKSQKPCRDLREYLNQKRQFEELKPKGPPSDPKYNFLSDPLRDNNEKHKTEQYGNANFSQRSHVDQRGRRGRGLMQGRGHYRGSNNYNFKSKEEDQDTFEEYEIDEKTKNNGAENGESSQFREKLYNRPFSYRANYQSRKYQGNRFENSQGNIDAERNSQAKESSLGNYRSRKYFPSRSMQRSTRRPAQYRGRPFKRNPISVDPVNITVEYSVNSGTRKCTIENNDTKADTEGISNSVNIPPSPGDIGNKCNEVNDEKDNEDKSKVVERKRSEKKLKNTKEEKNTEENKETKNVISKNDDKINEVKGIDINENQQDVEKTKK